MTGQLSDTWLGFTTSKLGMGRVMMMIAFIITLGEIM